MVISQIKRQTSASTASLLTVTPKVGIVFKLLNASLLCFDVLMPAKHAHFPRLPKRNSQNKLTRYGTHHSAFWLHDVSVLVGLLRRHSRVVGRGRTLLPVGRAHHVILMMIWKRHRIIPHRPVDIHRESLSQRGKLGCRVTRGL